jgi:ATP-dependent Zn protease
MADLSVYDQKLQTISEPMYNPNMHLQLQQEKQAEEDKKQQELEMYNQEMNNNIYNLPTQEHKPKKNSKQFSYDNLPQSQSSQYSENFDYEESELKHIIKVYIIPIIAFIILYVLFSLDVIKHIYENIFSFLRPDMNNNISILACGFYGLNIIIIFILINYGIQRFI